MSKVMKLFCCVGALALVLVARSAFADYAITLNDPSFESPVQGTDGMNIDSTSWSSNAPGFDANHGGGKGLNLNPTDDAVDGTMYAGTKDTTAGVPANTSNVLPDEGQIGTLSRRSDFDYRLVQQTGHTLIAGETLSLSYYTGQRADLTGWATWAGVTANLLDGSGNVIGSQHITTAPTAGTFAQYTLNATVGAGYSGLLTVQFIGDAVAGTLAQENIDKVSLASTVPEPTTFVLLASGLIGLLCYAWKKRK